SSNYVLYGDMSGRVMETLRSFSPNVEQYSIDEAFIEFTNVHFNDIEELGRRIKNTVTKCTGIPVSVGLARTKTLAKLANRLTKKDIKYDGVCSLVDEANIDEILETVKVESLWGVGNKYDIFLRSRGIFTA